MSGFKFFREVMGGFCAELGKAIWDSAIIDFNRNIENEPQMISSDKFLGQAIIEYSYPKKQVVFSYYLSTLLITVKKRAAGFKI